MQKRLALLFIPLFLASRLTASLVLYYNFENPQDTLGSAAGILDQSTSTNHGTSAAVGSGSAPSFSTVTAAALSHSTDSLSFTGDGGFTDGGRVLSSANSPITGNAVRSISLWLNTSANHEGDLITWGLDAINGQRFTLRLDDVSPGNYTPRIEIKGNGFTGTSIVNDGNWHNVILTYNGTNVRTYVNGTMDINATFSVTPGTVADPFAIGMSNNSAVKSYTGLLDDVAVFDHVLTSGEISSLTSGVNPTVIPEPSSLMLISLVGLAGLSLLHRKRT